MTAPSLHLDFHNGPPPSDPDDSWYVCMTSWGWTTAFMHKGVLMCMQGGGIIPVLSVHEYARLPERKR